MMRSCVDPLCPPPNPIYTPHRESQLLASWHKCNWFCEFAGIWPYAYLMWQYKGVIYNGVYSLASSTRDKAKCCIWYVPLLPDLGRVVAAERTHDSFIKRGPTLHHFCDKRQKDHRIWMRGWSEGKGEGGAGGF